MSRIVALTKQLSLSLNHRLGAGMGRLICRLPNSLRRVAERNLELCLPELSPTERAHLLRVNMIETGKGLLEMGPLWSWPRERIEPLVVAVEGAELMRTAVDQGNGVVLLCPHLGSWELVNVYHSLHYPLTSLYRPADNPRVDVAMKGGRERFGAQLVPTDATGVRALMKALQRGELVMILPDQEPGRNGGEFAPFFGVEAQTMVLLNRLVRKTGAPVVACYAERLPAAQGFRLHYRSAEPGIADPDPRLATTALNRTVEACVRELPEQYLWFYKRFRSRPQGGAKLY